MTGILLTQESFNRYAKNYKKIKPEIPLSQAQQELAQVFGEKDLFTLKKTLSAKPILINEDNFQKFSERLTIAGDLKEKEDYFGKIVGYYDKESFILNTFADNFIKFMYKNYRNDNSKIEKTIMFFPTSNRNCFILLFMFSYKAQNEKNNFGKMLGIHFSSNESSRAITEHLLPENFNQLDASSKEKALKDSSDNLKEFSKKEAVYGSVYSSIIDIERSPNYQYFNEDGKKEVKSLIKLFEGKDNSFIDKFYSVLSKKMNFLNNPYDKIIIGINNRKELTIVNDLYYKVQHYVVKKSVINQILSDNDKKIHDKQYIDLSKYASIISAGYIHEDFEIVQKKAEGFNSYVILEGLTLSLNHPETFIGCKYYEKDESNGMFTIKNLL